MNEPRDFQATLRSYTALTQLSLFGLAITIPLLLVLGALLLRSASEQRAQLENRIAQVLDALVNDIDRDLDRDITILRTLATSEAFKSEDWRSFHDQATDGLQGRAYLVLTDADGRQLVNTYVPYGQQPAITGDPDTVRRIKATRAPIVSNLFVSLVVKKPVFNVSIPILKDGQVLYVMSLGLLPADLVPLLNSQRLSPQWLALVWDANGAILARSHDTASDVDRLLPAAMRAHDTPGVIRTTDIDGADVLQAAARSKVSGWGVGVNVPYAVISEPMRNSMLLWSAVALFGVTVALMLGLFFARQISTSLAVAAQAATAFGRGEPVVITGSRLREADAFLATLKDAQHAREKLMDEVKRSRDWLRITLSSIGDAVIATDAAGRITFLNGVASSLTGWQDSEAIGRPMDEVFRISNEETGATMETPVARALREGTVVELANHTELSSKDGRQIPIEDSAAPIHDADGRMVGCVLVFRDISARRDAERQRAAIEQRNHEMMIALQEADHRKDEFLALLAHELRGPMAPLRTGVELIKQSHGADELVRRSCAAMERQLGQLVRLVNDLLDASRIAQGKIELRREPVDLSVLIQELAESERPLAEAAGLTFEMVLPQEPFFVDADPMRLTQVLRNLLQNARKYTDAGGRVEISLARKQGEAVLSVKDTGLGIPSNKLEAIFEMFAQVHRNLPRSQSGLGIGLALARRLVVLHGGALIARSEGPGRGSEFVVSLPLRGGDAPAASTVD